MPKAREYTIGWICAIATEFVAAQAFLEEKHEDPEILAPNDNNTYALGRIGRHNVAIATLPKSSIGTVSAAVVARDMVHTFPNIRVGLMVGVGGGAPSQLHDIRLGDVVVGCPGAGEGGIIQYDYGKTIQHQAFKETGHLNQPPQSILTAVTALEAKYALDGHRINDDVEGVFKRRPRLRKAYSLPPSDTDRLYRSDITHPENQSADCSRDCDSSHLIHRHERDDDEDNPAIHYGLIASANQLMKDALRRDELAMKRNVLCFEMEAAGLANHFPCLVVRGICDYSDTHKNKIWQGFAAMSAAAYAKDLLGQLAPSRIETEAPVAEILKTVEANQREQMQMLVESKAIIREMKSDQQFDHIRRWLKPPDTSTNANQARNLRHMGTGQWIFKSQVFQEWNNGSRQNLWLHGLAGCGKTVLSTTILDSLLSQDNQVALQFFFDFSDGQKQTVDQMVRGLVYQLYTITAGSAELAAKHRLEDLYTSHNRGDEQPGTNELSDCFFAMLKNSHKVYIVLDALDECADRKGILAWVVKFTSLFSLRHVKLLITCRPEVEFQQQIPPAVGPDNYVSLHLDSVNEDIRSYVNAQLRLRLGFKRWASAPKVLQRISEQVGDRADGMFRWAACQLDTLEDSLNLEEIETALKSLPKDLNETYSRILAQIPSTRKDKSILLLQVLVHSRQPLSLQQAVDLVAIGQQGFQPEYRMPDPAEIPRFCPSLVTIVDVKEYPGKIRKEVHLAHFSVKEYLVDSEGTTFNLTDASISMTHAFLSYLMGSAYVMRSAEIQYPETICPLEHAADQGHHQMVKLLLNRGADVKTQVNQHTTPLYQACTRRHLDIARTLLEHGADPNLPAGSFYPLGNASERGRLEIVRLLLDYGADVNASCFNGSPILLAATNGHEEVVRLLLESGADVNLRSSVDRSPLAEASMEGHVGIVHLLLRNHALVDGPTCSGSALLAAAQKGHASVVRLLLEYGATYEAQHVCEDPKSRYKGWDYESYPSPTLKQLQDNYRPRSGDDPLSVASKFGHGEVVRQFLEKRVPSNMPSQYWSGVLAITIKWGHYHITEMLVKAGVDVNAPVADYGCVLNLALTRRRLKVVELLWRQGADLNIRCTTNRNWTLGMNAVELARHLKLTEIANLISQAPPSMECEQINGGDFISKA
ncbi:Ankyrin repeat domain-containing protein 17 [Colletotrichum siamense]|nr:Ankyrin repeat domain-containing protein 17 [Colletotrichum siamense]KAF4875277.1 Ankyrin repeat domain-containing protein 17 [Colletotrichum siamense]